MQIATPLQAITGGPSFPTLEGWELLLALKRNALTASAFASPIDLSQPTFQIDTSGDLKTRLSITKQRTNVISNRQSFGWGVKSFPLRKSRIFRSRQQFPTATHNVVLRSEIHTKTVLRNAEQIRNFDFPFPVPTGSTRFVLGTVPWVLILPRSAAVGCTSQSGPSARRSPS